MSNIINFENFKKNKLVDEQIVSFFNMQSFPYEVFLNENSNDCVVVLKKHDKYLFSFFEFIPSGTFTELPSIFDRSEDILRNPRISNDEWVVFDVFLLRKDESSTILNNLSIHNNNSDYIKILKEKIKNIQ